MSDAPSASDPLAAIAKARGTARLIVTTTPGVTMTVLAQEELVDAIAAALAREAATQRHAADHWFTEANREHNARVRVEGERDMRATDLFAKILARAEQAERELAGMQTRDALVRQSARIAALEAALRPFAKFAEAFDAKPIARLDDEFYAIHTGTQWEASLRLSDCRAARAALAPPERP